MEKIWIPVWVMWQICVLKCRDKAAFINMGLPDILDYEKMKDKLQVRICDREWNENVPLIKLLPNMEILQHITQ